MILRNDKERREFVQNPDNWETISTVNNLVRLRRFVYKEQEWFCVEILQTYQHYNHIKKGMVWISEWRRLGIYQINTESRAFNYGTSVTEIIEQIKNIDRKEMNK